MLHQAAPNPADGVAGSGPSTLGGAPIISTAEAASASVTPM